MFIVYLIHQKYTRTFLCFQLNDTISKCTSLIEAVQKGNPLHLSFSFKNLLPILLQNLHSPLAAPYLTKLFVDLHHTVFSNDLLILGESIAYVTLRLLKPQCDIESAWEEEDLTKAMIRTMNAVHERTVTAKNEDHAVKCFTAPAFCYLFVFLKSSLLSCYAKNHETFVHDGLQIISVHSKLRSRNDGSVADVFHPKHLPLQQMFELLLELISE